jgi:hypothetical protein
MVTMKIRSCVLIICMVVVPGLALFSHLTPPAARDLIRHMLREPLRLGVRALAEAIPSGAVSGPRAEAMVPAPPEPEPEPLAAASSPRAPANAVESSPPSATRSSSAMETPRSPAEWAVLGDLRHELASLGATAIDCRPQPGDLAGYVSRCRIGIDPEGQLHRMFHGRGADAAAAMQSLVEQVRAWQTRQASGPPTRY